MSEKNFIDKLNRLAKVKERYPQRAASLAVNFSKERFRRKNWVDKTRQPWVKPKRKKKKGSLLIDSGRLKRSIRKILVTQSKIVIGTDVPYARIHNEGGKITQTVNVRAHSRRIRRNSIKKEIKVRAHSRKINTSIPQRQFIGNSALLMRRLQRLLQKDIINAIKH